MFMNDHYIMFVENGKTVCEGSQNVSLCTYGLPILVRQGMSLTSEMNIMACDKHVAGYKYSFLEYEGACGK